MLILPIKRKWFDMILSGEKKEEYRDIKPYYDTRLMDAFGMIWVGDELIRAPMPELQKNRVQLVAFRNGYGKDVPTIWTECSLSAGQIYPINNVFISIINNAMIENERGEYSVTEPFFNPIRGILWKNNVCKLRAHFRTDDKNIKVLKSLKGVDITPEVPEE